MLLKWITATLFHTVIMVYVEDVFIVETAETIQSAIEIFKIVCETLGFELEKEKEQAPTTKLSLQGAEITIFENHLNATLPTRKANDLINELRQILTKNSLTPAH